MSLMKICDILNGKSENQEISIRGWIYRKRKGKNLIFLLVRDSSGFIQCTVKKSSLGWNEAERITIESSLTLKGIPKLDKRAPGGFEISVNSISIIGLAEIFPITKDQSKDFLRNVRHLWLRSRKMNLIMKIRDRVLDFTRTFFKNQEFISVSPPMFISAAVEGGSTLFDLKYFDQTLYLTQSSQLYLEILIYSLEKVYCIAPSFRAEKSRTIRHLTEYWHIEGEWPYAKMSDLMNFEESLVSYICEQTLLNCKTELEELEVNIDKLKLVKTPFPRITYNDSIERLNKKGIKLAWGTDLGYEEEKILANEFGKPFFIYDYPTEIKAFYCKTHKDNPELAMSVDMLVPRIGEISTGGAREDDKEVLVNRMNNLGLNVEDYSWYIDLRRYGTVPHVGFGLGLERLLVWMLDLDNVIDSIPFPRTTRRFYP